MSEYIKENSILSAINQAVSEVNSIHNEIKTGERTEYSGLSLDLAAKHQFLLDAAEREIAEEYAQSGSLSGTKVCEINRSMDDYSLSYQGVMALLNSIESNGE